jgi:hypothetical protein
MLSAMLLLVMETNTATETLRDKVRAAIIDEVPERAAREHRRNYHRLHIWRDGTVSWSEYIDQHSDTIDSQADHFCAVKSACLVGTGSYLCNCDYCEDDGFETVEEAIANAVCDGDNNQIEADMLDALDQIEIGYFDDEDEK